MNDETYKRGNKRMETILNSLETLERKLLYIQSVVKMSKSTLKQFDEQNEGTAFLMEGLKTIEMFLPYEELAELYEQLIINVQEADEDEAEKTASGSSLSKEIIFDDNDLPF